MEESPELYHNEHAHPQPREYAQIASILTVITGFEVALYFFTGVGHSTLIAMLLVLMVVKFFMVVGWYMHLKFDHKYYTYIFGGGLFVAAAIVIALVVLFAAGDAGQEIVRQLPAGETH